jgi:hypothetical protein
VSRPDRRASAASRLQPILAKNEVEIDKGFASTWPGAATLEGNWAQVFGQMGDGGWRGSLCCAAPGWAAVTWTWWGSTNRLTVKPFKTNGLSILDIKKGKIVRETFYWNVPGRNAGIAPSVGRKYATALLVPAWGARPPSPLYSKNALRIDAAVAPSTQKVDHRIWANAGVTPLHASLCCAAPSQKSDNGKMARSWAAVVWEARVAGSTAKLSGVSILELNRRGKIARETLYHW